MRTACTTCCTSTLCRIIVSLFCNPTFNIALAYMTWEVHGFVWDEISQYHQYFGHPAGLQKYLEFCKRNGITRERLEKECSYEGWDILTLYDRQTAKTAPPKMRKDMER